MTVPSSQMSSLTSLNPAFCILVMISLTVVDLGFAEDREETLKTIDTSWHNIGLAGSTGFHNPEQMTTLIENINHQY